MYTRNCTQSKPSTAPTLDVRFRKRSLREETILNGTCDAVGIARQSKETLSTLICTSRTSSNLATAHKHTCVTESMDRAMTVSMRLTGIAISMASRQGRD